ncbi:MAG: hypothetical protein ACE5IZ_05410 [Dehalococcoidia bacterium]
MYEEDEPEELDEELDEAPDERDADLGWGGPELPLEPTLGQRTRQALFTAIILVLLAAIILPLVITAMR